MNNIKRRNKIHFKIRKANLGNKPRLAVYKSNSNIYAQIIDDNNSKTLVYANSLESEFKKNKYCGYNIMGATEIGILIGKRAKENKITEIIFDRGGFPYHGRIKALAEGARQFLKF